MKIYYLVYKIYPKYDGVAEDTDVYVLGLFSSVEQAKELCEKDFCKNTFYKALELDKEIFTTL